MDYYPLRFRLYPNEQQATLLSKTAGCTRFLYNHFLELTLPCVREREIRFDAYFWIKSLTNLKKIKEWLEEVDSTSLQQSVINLGKSYDNFLSGRNREPTKHKKGRKEGFRVTMSNQIDLDGKKIKIGKLGWLKARGNFGGYNGEKINQISVTLESDGNWYCSVLIQKETSIPNHQHKYSACGIDVGVAKPLTVCYTTTKGKDLHRFWGLGVKDALKRKEIRRKRYQRALARKVKGSNNRVKAKKKVAKAFYREKMVRKDWVEKSSHKVAKTFTLVSVEDLRLANMTKSAKGTVEEPGKSVKAKSGLNHELLRLGLSFFFTRLEQKCQKFGGQFVRVNPKHTSLDCRMCGNRSSGKESRKSQSRYECVVCGHCENADVNAGFNIRNRALA